MIIGVTGGVGSGKSTILQILQENYHAAIILADDVAKDLMMPGEACYDPIVAYFGTEILTDGYGSPINRNRLAEIVFQEPDKLQKLNQMTHPPVKIRIKELAEQFRAKGYPIIVIETALLIQAGYIDLIDELWVVYSDYESRKQRLIASRGYSEQKIQDIMRNQLSDEEMQAYADFVIDNSGTLSDTESQITEHFRSGEHTHAGNQD